MNLLKLSKKLERIKDKFPKEAFKDGKLDETRLLKNNLYESCEDIDSNVLKVDYMKDKFIFDLESFGQLSPKEVLEESIISFNRTLDKFIKSLKSVKPTTIKALAKKITG